MTNKRTPDGEQLRSILGKDLPPAVSNHNPRKSRRNVRKDNHNSHKKVKRVDGWGNFLTGLGQSGKDKSLATFYATCPVLTQPTLDAMYRSDGLAKRVIDVIAEEMTREWIEVVGDPDGEVLEILKTLGAKDKFADIISWARLYGGALGVIGINDGGNLDDPVNEGSIESVEFLHVFDATEVDLNSSDHFEEPTNPKFGEIEFYSINNGTTGAQFKVHESRVIRMDGVRTSKRTRQQNKGWSDSVLQSLFESIRNFGVSHQQIFNIITEFNLGILTIDGLNEKIAADEEGLVQKRLQLMDMTKDIINTLALDTGETYEKKSTNVSGLAGLIDKFAEMVTGTTGIPLTVLLGKTPGGLNADSSGEIRLFYDKLKSQQESKLEQPLRRLIRYVMLANGSELENWSIKYNALWQMTEKEEADIRKTTAEIDQIYLDNGVTDPEEIRESRFGGQSYSAETEIKATREININNNTNDE